MCFTPAHVIITGSNLGALLDDIAAFRLGCLRSLPADYSASGSTNGTFISRIEVRAAERDLGDKS
jgi:hypothetical protein